MGEFVNRTSEQAAATLRQTYEQESTPGMDAILELIGCLLEDGAGGVISTTVIPVTIDDWLTWNQMVMEEREELLRTMTIILEWERMELPTEAEAMRNWAAWLLLATLERMGMQ